MSKSMIVALLSAVVGALVAVPIAVYASHRFIDVSSSNTFHDDIAWLGETGITRGCNPPANTEFCPEEYVTRGQMAAFMRRFANTGVGFDPGRLYATWNRQSTGETNAITESCDEGDVLLSGATLLEPGALLAGDLVYDDGPTPAPDDLWTRPDPHPNVGPEFRVDGPLTGWSASMDVADPVDFAVVAYCYDVP